MYTELPLCGIPSAFAILFKDPVNESEKLEIPTEGDLVFVYNNNWVLKI